MHVKLVRTDYFTYKSNSAKLTRRTKSRYSCPRCAKFSPVVIPTKEESGLVVREIPPSSE